MSVSKLIPFRNNEYNGIFQAIIDAEQREMFQFNVISVASEPQHTSEEVLFNNSNYYASEYRTSFLENYFQIEFKDRFVHPTGYVLFSHDSAYMQSWKLECSILNQNDWKKLHSETDVDYIKKATWFSLKGGPCKFLKITQTGESFGSGINEKYRMRIAYLDFFGLMTNGNFCSVCDNIKIQIMIFPFTTIYLLL